MCYTFINSVWIKNKLIIYFETYDSEYKKKIDIVLIFMIL